MDNSKSLDGYTGEEVTSPIKAIRKYCLVCSCYQSEEVKKCTVYDCYLYPFRMGHSPYRQPRELSDEQREAIRERAKNLHTPKTPI